MLYFFLHEGISFHALFGKMSLLLFAHVNAKCTYYPLFSLRFFLVRKEQDSAAFRLSVNISTIPSKSPPPLRA